MKLSSKSLLGALSLALPLAVGFAPSARAIVIDFETIPDYPTPLGSFSSLYSGSGVTLSGTDWKASAANNSFFDYVHSNSGLKGIIETLTTNPLTISFSSMVTGVSLDLGTGIVGNTGGNTFTISRTVGGSPIGSADYSTVLNAHNGNELHVSLSGSFDGLVITPWTTYPTSSGIVDNLTFTAVPEPSSIAAVTGLSLGGFAFMRRRMKQA